MEPFNTHFVEDATRISAPVEVVGALRRIIAEDFHELDDITPHEIDRIARAVDDEIEIDLEYAPHSRARFVKDRHGRAHIQYWTHRASGEMELEGDWPVNPADAETTARAIWYLIAQTHFAVNVRR